MTGFKPDPLQRAHNRWRRITSSVGQRLQTVTKSGLSPRKLALTLCIGVALGVMPLLWGTSLLCIILAYLFRLNHVALQSLNYLLYPMQLALLLPFFRLGDRLFPWGPPVPHHILAILVQKPDVASIQLLGWILLKSLAAWSITVLPILFCLYLLLAAILTSKLGNRYRLNSGAPERSFSHNCTKSVT